MTQSLRPHPEPVEGEGVRLSPDAARLKSVRESLAAIAPARWNRVHDVSGVFVEAKGQMAGELFVLARFDPLATDDEIAFVVDAPDHVRFLLRLLDEAFGTIRKLKGIEHGEPRASSQKNYAAECAIACLKPAFKLFLAENHGLERPLTDERVAQKVRSLLGVVSRKELNDGGEAGRRWQKLRGDFAAWKRGQR